MSTVLVEQSRNYVVTRRAFRAEGTVGIKALRTSEEAHVARDCGWLSAKSLGETVPQFDNQEGIELCLTTT